MFTRRPFRLRPFVLDVLVALSLAFLVWLYARSRALEALDNIEIPVQISLAPGTADNYELEITGSGRVPVSFSGPPYRIRELRQQIQRGLEQVAVTLTVPEDKQKESTYRDTVRVEAAAVPVPPGVSAVVVEGRNLIPVTLHRLAERYLPVHLDYAGDARLSGVKVEPATVAVRGPKDLLDRARFLSTQPYTLPATESETADETQVRGQVAVLNEIDGRSVKCTPDAVTLRFRAHPKQKTYEIADVPVLFLCPPGCPWRPHFANAEDGKVTVRVVGPAAEDPPAVLAFMDLTQNNLGKGKNVAPLRLQLPKEFQLVQDAPRLLTFYLDPIDALSE
jgi:hypothetical protein